MLSTLLHAKVRIDRFLEGQPQRSRLEGVIIDDDGNEHLIWFFEGQMKEVTTPVEVGKTYRATFLPFVNNRWVEVRVTAMEEIEG